MVVNLSYLKMIMTYYTVHNGGRPFKVDINDNNVDIFKKNNKKWEKILSCKPIKIFIGKWDLHNDYDGNSILLEIADKQYVYIGEYVYKFVSYNKIIKYISPVGNSEVVYPFAVDDDNNYYLMIENIIFKSENELNDPYRYYYDNIIKIKKYENKYFIEDEEYTMTYYPNPIEDYNRITKDIGTMYLKENGTEEKTELKIDKYIEIMSNYAKEHNLKRFLNYQIIEKRNY